MAKVCTTSKMKWLKKAPIVVVATLMKLVIALQRQNKRDSNPKSLIWKAKWTEKEMILQAKGGDPIFDHEYLSKNIKKRKKEKVQSFLIWFCQSLFTLNTYLI